MTSYRFRVLRFAGTMIAILIVWAGVLAVTIPTDWWWLIVLDGLATWLMLRWYLTRERRDMYAPYDRFMAMSDEVRRDG